MLNPNTPLKRERIEELAREAPEALLSLVMVMQEQLAEMRAEISRLQARGGRTRRAKSSAERAISAVGAAA